MNQSNKVNEYSIKLAQNILAYVELHKKSSDDFMENDLKMARHNLANWYEGKGISRKNIEKIRVKYPELLPDGKPKGYRNSDLSTTANDNGDNHVTIDCSKVPKELLEKYNILVKLEFKLKQ